MTDNQDNVFIGDTPNNIQEDKEDKLVSSTIELLKSSKVDPNREIKSENIKENIEKKKDFHAKLPNGKRPLMKASLYAVMNRKIRINGIRNPRIDSSEASMKADLAKEILNEGLDEINFPRLHKAIYKKYDNEGTAFVFILKENGKLKSVVIPFDDFFYDPGATELEDEHMGFFDGNMRWCGFRMVIKRATFNKEYPEWADKVASGSPLDITKESEEILTEEGEEKNEWDLDEDVEVFYTFSLINEDPVMTVIAGRSCTKIAEESGADYEYYADNGEPVIPVTLFHFSDEKVGAVSASVTDFVKDGAEAIKRNLNAVLQNTSRIVNAPTYIFGSADDSEMEEIMNYYNMQEAGYAPLIQRRDPNINIQTLAPQDATSTYRAVKDEVYDDLSERTGIMLRKLDNDPNQKVGIFVRLDRDEGEAIRIIDGRNEDAFRRLAYHVYWFKKTLPLKNKKIVLGQGLPEMDIKAKQIRELLKDFNPKWIIDTDMDRKLTFQERVRSRDVVANDLILIMNTNIKPDLAEPIGRNYYRKAVMLGLGKDYTEEDFINAAKQPGVEDPTKVIEGVQGMNIEADRIGNEPKQLAEV